MRETLDVIFFKKKRVLYRKLKQLQEKFDSMSDKEGAENFDKVCEILVAKEKTINKIQALIDEERSKLFLVVCDE